MKTTYVLSIAALVAIVMAIWIPSRTSPENIGKYQLQEATKLLGQLPQLVEKFYQERGHPPDVNELPTLITSGQFVAKLAGNNPYVITMKMESVYPEIAGKTLIWKFDPSENIWDECSMGSVDLRYKSLKCRRSTKAR